MPRPWRAAGPAADDGSADGGGGAPSAEPVGAVQEVVESLAMALVLALVVREFGFEAFKIPTGSMEPTILGDGALSNGNRRAGDRLLAFKPATYHRWDIVVFRFPLFRNTNYIKRLIGLPGERLEIRHGDVYVNGAVVPKPDDVQAVMWRRAFSPTESEEWISRFDPDQVNAWTFRRGHAEVDAPASAAWCQLRDGFEDDHRVSFDVEWSRPGTVLVSVEGAERRCTLEVGPESSRVTAPGVDADVPGLSLASLGPRFRLGLSASDRVCRVFADGRQVASFRHDDAPNGGTAPGRVRIGAKDLRATVRAVVVENDVQYGTVGTSVWDIPADGHVMLGDNTGSSRDSRYWAANVVTLKDGRTFIAPDYARVTEDREEAVFRKSGDGDVEMTDSWGVRRSFRAAEIATIERNQPQPFVRADDLVGRAFLVFFPFPPWGDFRPRLLR